MALVNKLEEHLLSESLQRTRDRGSSSTPARPIDEC